MVTSFVPRASYSSLRAIARLVTFTTALFLSHDALARGGNDFRDRSVIGKWKLVSVLDLAAIASLDEMEAKAMLGKYVTISAKAVTVDEEVCSPPEFWAERIAPEPHMQDKLHSTAERLRLPNPATMVELGCTDVYIRNPGELVLLWGGAMFEAVRIIPQRAAKPKGREANKPSVGAAKPGRTREISQASAKKPPIGSSRDRAGKTPVPKGSSASRLPMSRQKK